MSAISFGLSSEVNAYLIAHSVHEHPVLARLREMTQSSISAANMQISPEQGQLLQWLIRLHGARRILEIGTFTGYSALAMALALPETGFLYTCDIDEKTTKLARPYWDEAGVGTKIEQKLGQGLDCIAELARAGISIDFAFIDADKANYLAYYQAILPLLAQNGLIAIDNVLWSGDVADLTIQDKQTQAIRALNDFVYADPRVDACMLPIGDGLTLVRKY